MDLNLMSLYVFTHVSLSNGECSSCNPLCKRNAQCHIIGKTNVGGNFIISLQISICIFKLLIKQTSTQLNVLYVCPNIPTLIEILKCVNARL